MADDREKKVLRALGLNTYSDPYSEASDGTFVTANNVNIDRPSLIEPRRGFQKVGNIVDATDITASLKINGNRAYIDDSTLKVELESFEPVVGEILPPEGGSFVDSVDLNENTFITTYNGIKKARGTSYTGGSLSKPVIQSIVGTDYSSISIGEGLSEGAFLGISFSFEKVLSDGSREVGPKTDTYILHRPIGGDPNFLVSVQVTAAEEGLSLVQHRTREVVSGDFSNLDQYYRAESVDLSSFDVSNGYREFEISKKGLHLIDDDYLLEDSRVDILEDAGIPQPANLYKQSSTGTGEYVAYRTVLGYKDSSGDLILGPPSKRIVVETATASHNVVLRSILPVNLEIGGKFLQLYRTKISSSSEPGDEMYLASEEEFSFSSRPSISYSRPITDTTVDDLLGVPLYTNASQEGLVNGNYEPPACKYIEEYQGHTFYANTSRKSEITLDLLGVGSEGIQDGYKLKIGDIWYVFANSTATAYTPTGEEVGGVDENEGGPFPIYIPPTTGSVTQDIIELANNIINKVAFTHPTVIAKSTSENSDNTDNLGSEIVFSEIEYNIDNNFTVKLTDSAGNSPVNKGFSPDIREGVVSIQETYPNRLYYSKYQEPEAVPLLNFLSVGDYNTIIHGIKSLRGMMLVFTNKGIYNLSGSTSNSFQIDLMDSTVSLVAPNSLVKLNNSVFGLFNQGVCQVSESVRILSRVIEGDLLEMVSDLDVYTKASAIGYESDRKYILRLEGGKTYVYNVVTKSFTTWDTEEGILTHDEELDRLRLIGSTGEFIERKSIDKTDHVDHDVDINISYVNGSILTVDIPELSSLTDKLLYNDEHTTAAIPASIGVGNEIEVNSTYVDFLQDSTEVKVLDKSTFTSATITEVSVGGDDRVVRINIGTSGTGYRNIGGLVSGDIITSGTSNVAEVLRVSIDTVTDPGSLLLELSEDWYTTGSVLVGKVEGPTLKIHRKVDNTHFKPLNQDLASISVGSVYKESESVSSRISNIDLDNGNFTVDNDLSWSTGQYTISKSIDIEVEWNPIYVSSPSELKQFSEATLVCVNPMSEVDLDFATLQSTQFEGVRISNSLDAAWGRFSWGSVQWGLEEYHELYRTFIPRGKQRATTLRPRIKESVVFNKFAVSGINVVYRNISTRNS